MVAVDHMDGWIGERASETRRVCASEWSRKGLEGYVDQRSIKLAGLLPGQTRPPISPTCSSYIYSMCEDSHHFKTTVAGVS